MKLISWISLAALSLVTFSAMGQNNLILKNWESNKSLVEQSVENSLLSDFRDLLLPFSPLIGERSDVAYYFGILYAKMGKNHRAIGYFRQSLERDSDNSAARWGLAQALLLNQKWAEALSELNHLSENSSSSSFWRARKSEIIYYQGVCLFRLDKYSDARKKFIQSLYFENSSNAEQASSAQKFLKAIQSKAFLH